jgi:hypothetical protein
MEANLGLALQITAIGMSLVFAAILLLWGVMALLVRLTAGRAAAEPAAAAVEADVPSLGVEAGAAARRARLARRAAAVAVSIVLAQSASAPERAQPAPPPAAMSPWQAVMRANQLKQRGPTR